MQTIDPSPPFALILRLSAHPTRIPAGATIRYTSEMFTLCFCVCTTAPGRVWRTCRTDVLLDNRYRTSTSTFCPGSTLYNLVTWRSSHCHVLRSTEHGGEIYSTRPTLCHTGLYPHCFEVVVTVYRLFTVALHVHTRVCFS
eukprot:m.235071 g.235071  ORF g.235071 m.235071 type:complete len:141 (+) comp19331_c0_seq2:90-512(+)